jgi:hypothetical protein
MAALSARERILIIDYRLRLILTWGSDACLYYRVSLWNLRCAVYESLLCHFCYKARSQIRAQDPNQLTHCTLQKPIELMIIVTIICTVINPKRHGDAIFPFCGLPCRDIIRSPQTKLRPKTR